MKAVINGATFHQMKTVPSKKQEGVSYRFAELRDVESFTKLELFVSDDFSSPIPATGAKVNAEVKISERANNKGISMTLVGIRP